MRIVYHDSFFTSTIIAAILGIVSKAERSVYRGDGVCCPWHNSTQNKRGYAHLTERGAEIPGRAKNDSAAVKLAQEGK